MATFSPAPWRACIETGMDDEHQYWAIRDSIPRQSRGGRSYFGLIATGGVVGEDLCAAADAHLIAAAPDLYAACMRVIDCEGDGTIFEPDSPFAAIVDAVRKAQGGMQ